MKPIHFLLGACAWAAISQGSQAQGRVAQSSVEFREINGYTVDVEWVTKLQGINQADGQVLNLTVMTGESPGSFQRTMCHDAILRVMDSKGKYHLILSVEYLSSDFYKLQSCTLKALR